MVSIPNISNNEVVKIGHSFGVSKALVLAPSILAIAVCVIIAGMVIWPKFNQVMKLKGENKDLATRVAALDAKSKFLAGLSSSDLERELIDAETLLPSDKAVFSMLSLVEKAASSSGVILSKVDLVPGGASESANTGAGLVGPGTIAQASGQGDVGPVGIDTPRLQIKVSITSDYLSALRFIDSLVASRRVLSITDLSISTSATSGGSSGLISAMTVNAFFKPLPKELPAIEAQVEDINESELAVLRSVESTQESAVQNQIPQVPLGRPDLFAPF